MMREIDSADQFVGLAVEALPELSSVVDKSAVGSEARCSPRDALMPKREPSNCACNGFSPGARL